MNMNDENEIASAETSASKTKPSLKIQWLVSLLVGIHFFAILTAVTSSGSGKYTSPYVAMQLNEPFQPYLETLFLRNGYRFFAPNPGPNFVVWFRLSYQDGRIRWIEFPKRQNFATPLAYTRMLSVANMGSTTYPDEDDPDKGFVNPVTQICLSSFARHIGSEKAVTQSLRDEGDLMSIEIYRIAHLYIMPDQIREGWDYTDLRLYQPMYLGAYRSDGTQIDKDVVRYCKTPILVSDMISNDIVPELFKIPVENQTPETLLAELDRLGIPEPVRRLVYQNPEMIASDAAEVTDHVLRALGLDSDETNE